MDTCSLVREPRSKKLKGKSDSYGHSRSLDEFHETILKHIISFLPLQSAVQTSVLSKRWKFMWTSLPSLVFQEYRHEKGRKQFMDFVERVLIFHDLPWIREFSLTCDVGDDASRIRTWVSFAVRHDARKFVFYLNNGRGDDTPLTLSDNHVFPHCLFSCETMEVLKIETIGFPVPLPSQIYLPYLKTLILKEVIFQDYHPTNLLFGSPALEELVLYRCTWEMNINEITISAPELWSLTINEGHDDYDSMNELASNSMTISAPKLEIFNYMGGLPKEYRFPSPPSISKASLRYSGMEHDDRFDEVLRSLLSVKYLQISTRVVQALSHATVPIFENLIFLEVDGTVVNLCCETLQRILNNCPRLEVLRLERGICKYSATYNFDRLLSFKLTYLPSSLKKLILGSFCGSITELSGVQFLLEKLTSLETMEIHIEYYVTQRKEVEALLSALPRGSKSCKLDYSPKWLSFEQIVSNLG